MRPLSTLNFIKNNKRHTISSATAIVVAIVFLFMLECFIESMIQSSYYAYGKTYRQQIELCLMGNEQIPKSTVDGILKNADIERVIPAAMLFTTYDIYGAGGDAEIFGLRDSDVAYFMKKHGAALEEGRLPKAGKNEIALNGLVAKNKGLKIGDKIGSNVDNTESLNGEYTVVGLLDGTDCVSLMGDPFSQYPDADETGLMQNGLIAFPKAGRLEAAGDSLTKYSSENVKVCTLSWLEKSFNGSLDSAKIMDVIALISIIVIAICLVCSKYAQFYNRKAEFGILYAMGFSRRSIMRSALREVTVVNIGSFVVGFVLGILSCVVFIGNMYGRSGGIPVFICQKAVVMSIIAPLFTTLFTLVPVFRMLSSVDPVSIIESN